MGGADLEGSAGSEAQSHEGGSLETLRRIHPELHDEGEDYPGFDEDSLEEKMRPVLPSVFTIPPEGSKA